jgi:hypothetical protein
MDESQLDQVRQTLEALLPEMDMDGLALSDVGFDFYSRSVDAMFEWSGKRVKLRLTMERVNELQEGKTFAAKRLRETLRKTFGCEEA